MLHQMPTAFLSGEQDIVGISLFFWHPSLASGLRLAEHGMAPGARPDVWTSPRLVGDPLHDAFKVCMDQVLPFIGPWNFRGAEIDSMVKNLMDPVWLGKATPEETMPRVAEEIQKILEMPREEA